MLYLTLGFVLLILTTVSSSDVKGLSNPIEVRLGENGIQTTISLGTPGQDFNVVLDTNVAGLWIPGKKCKEGSAEVPCDNKNVFAPTDSYTFTDADEVVSVSFLGEDIALNVSFDKFHFGPHYETALSANNIKFGVVDELPSAYEDFDADGVLGLGTITKDGLDSPFVQLVKRGILPNSLISISIPKNLNSHTNPPTISIGTEDLENCEIMTPRWEATLVPQRNWAFQVDSYFQKLSSRDYNATATIDFTSDYIYVPVNVFANFVKSPYIKEDPITKELLITCNVGPLASFVIGDQNQIDLDKSYITKEIGGGTCALKIKQSPKPYEKEFRLGLPFLKNRCTVFNFNGRLGFTNRK